VANDAAEAESIYPNVRSFLDDGTGKAALPGADEAAIMPRDPVYAAIAVRKGLLVFGISFPEGDGSRDRLVQLAKLVLERGDALTH